MFLPQRLREYLDNPMGKGSTAIAHRQLLQNDLNSRYDKLLKRHKDFKHTIYKDGDEYYFHFEIPSETERENTYDVIIQFTMGEEDFKYDNFLHRYYLKFFSNCPSFTYTFAYVYNDYDMLIDFVKNKYDDIVLSDNPLIRNPGEIINYEKSIYFACHYIQMHSQMMNKMPLNAMAKKLDKTVLNKIIRNTDQIQVEIKKEENRLKKEKEQKKSEIKKVPRPDTKTRGTKMQKNATKSPMTSKSKSIQKVGPSTKIKPTMSTAKKK